MKRLAKLFVLTLFMFSFHSVLADECTKEQLNNLKALANNVQVNVEFDVEAVESGFYDENIVTVQNLDSDLYLLSRDYSVGFYYTDNIDGIITMTVGSDIETLNVYSKTCPDVVLREIKLSTKSYNVYALYEECDGIDGEDLDVCSEYYDGEISYDEFVRKVNKYKEQQSGDAINLDDSIPSYYFIIGAAILVVVVIVVFGVIRRKRNRLD